MQVGFELYQKQTMKLSLTPELQQSIKILQYSTHELIGFLNRQAYENPVLEISFKDPLASLSASSIRTPKIKSLKRSSKSKSFNGDNDYNPINNYSINTETLESHLLEQVSLLSSLKAIERRILQFLIGNLNEYGFLELDTNWTASHFSMSVEEIEKMIQVLQSLDPIGVGAKDLADCLLIQLREHEARNELAVKIVKKHLTDLAEKRYRKIAALYKATIQEVQEASDFIRTLNPRPVSHFSNDLTHYIIPDVYVEKEKEDFLITVNDSCTPKLSISPFYKDHIALNPVNPAKDYIKGHINMPNYF
ncbi:hypothetical protein [Bacillus sp. B4EP4a]|uniref:RNA polymerase factor sigma-54 n=1 Tax=Bacillus sp. B4EP4a TaxID=2590665 RepID=UPI0011533BD3|nr:hypothetical protein [Bacillus sp. B4EP4a]